MLKGFAKKLLSLAFIVSGVASAQAVPPGLTPVEGTLRPLSHSAQSAPVRKDIPSIAKSANGSIVSIVMSDKDGKPLGQGSGFLVSNDGLLVTNYHVIAEGVVASDKSRDVAILKARGHNFRPLSLGNSDRVQVGEDVVAIGSPLSLESTVSNGIVSGMRTAEDLGGKFLQVTAPISPGSSGGPLFNMMGEVIGITTMYIKGGENLNFAIPINDAKRLLLSKSSTLRDWPNENESAKTEKRDHEEFGPSLESLGSPARKFYEQDNDAGVFAPEEFGTAPDGSKLPLGRMQNADYACFSDARSDEFFTFRAWAYDKEYDESSDAMHKIVGHEEFTKLMEIQKMSRQRAPGVNLLSRNLIEDSGSSLREFFLGRGRLLKKDVYLKGIKVETLEYHWDGSSWFFHDLQFLGIWEPGSVINSDMPSSPPRARHLSIQLNEKDLIIDVLRYVESDADRHVVASGYCKRVTCSPRFSKCM